jgi:hypothetical protein
MSDVKTPDGNRYLDAKKMESKRDVEIVFGEFKKLLADKTHPENQTAAYNKNVISTLNRLMVAADSLDSHNPGEGIFGLIILSLRSILKLKDRDVELEVKIKGLEKEINRLKKR